MIKNKYLLFLAFLIVFLFLNTNSISALEVDFGLGNNPTLPEYASFFFTWGISIAGILALISFAIGAVGLIVSGDSPELASSSRDRMRGAILGLVLTLASFIIMYTINPALITFTLTPLPPIAAPPLTKQPGIYYYLNPGCEGTDAILFTTSQNKIENPTGEIACMKFVDDPENDIFYGVIIHQTPDHKKGGVCMLPMTSEETETIQLDPNLKTFSADIFRLNMEFSGSAGDGVSFYSEPQGWDTGLHAGFLHILDPDIGTEMDNPFYADQMCFDYKNTGKSDAYIYRCNDNSLITCNLPPCKCPDETFSPYCCSCSNGPDTGCTTFQNCSGSIQIVGDYLVGLYSPNPSGGVYCQTFTKDEENLKGEPFIASGGKYVDTVYIIPIKN